jgi:hypothetical protein
MSTIEGPCQLFHTFRPAAFGGSASSNAYIWTIDTEHIGTHLAAVKDGGRNNVPVGHVSFVTSRPGGAEDVQQMNDDIITDTHQAWAKVEAPVSPRDNMCVQYESIFMVAPALPTGKISVPPPPDAGTAKEYNPLDAKNAYQGYAISKGSPCHLSPGSLPVAFKGQAANEFVWELTPNKGGKFGPLPNGSVGAYFLNNAPTGVLHTIKPKSPAKVQANVAALPWVKVAAPVLPRDAACGGGAAAPEGILRANSVGKGLKK